MVRSLAIVALAASALLALGCSGASVHAKHDEGYDFARLKTYRWGGGKQFGTAGREVGGKTIPQLVMDSVDRELATKGLRKVESADADFAVTYQTILTQKMVQSPSTPDYADRWDRYDTAMPAPPPLPRTPVSYPEGTVVIDFVDPKTGRSIWHGSAESAIKQGIAPEERQKRLDAVVHKMFADYPPRAK